MAYPEIDTVRIPSEWEEKIDHHMAGPGIFSRLFMYNAVRNTDPARASQLLNEIETRAIAISQSVPPGGTYSYYAGAILSAVQYARAVDAGRANRPYNHLSTPTRVVIQEHAENGELDALAGELVSLSSEAELDHFFGDFVKKAMGGIKKFAASPVGQTLVSGLKSVAKQALPTVAGAIGNAIAPGAGGAIGQKIGSFAAQNLEQDAFLADLLGETAMAGEENLLPDLLGNEAETMEKAKQVVKVAAAATKKAKSAPPTHDVRAVVRDAIMEAMKEYAPNLLSHHGGGHAHAHAGAGNEGRWYRRGAKIVLVGA
jgi:hypothetical protein